MHYHFLDWSLHLIRRLSTVLPSSCALCGSSGNASLCDACNAQFFRHHPHRCAQCALPTVFPAAQCGTCLRDPAAFDATITATDYAPPSDQLVLELKFGNQLALAPLFARMMLDAVLREPAFPIPDLLTVVPLGAQRLSERGFNQSLEIARTLAPAMAIPLLPQLLERTRETLMQASLSPAERHRNIRHAFVLRTDAIEHVRGRHIGVVDDVLTTGATLHEIAATLKRYGAARVTNLVFARTPPR